MPVRIPDDEPVLDSAAWLERLQQSEGYAPFALGRWVIEPNTVGGRTHSFDPAVPLDNETFDRYYQSVIPYKRMTERRAYQLLGRARRRLLHTVQLHSNVRRHGEYHRNHDAHQVALTITAAVTDWLNYSFIYLQNEETFLKHLGGDEFQAFENATHEAYDRYPAYAFLYRLRNFAQHYGPPLAALDLSSTDGNGWDIDIMLDKRELLGNSFSWNPRCMAVLDRLPERFSVMPLIEEATKGYQLIERRTLRIYLYYVESWLEESKEMLDRLDDAEGWPCLLAMPPDGTKSMQVLGGVVGVVPIMSREQVAKVEWSLQQADPIAAAWQTHTTPRGFSPDSRATLEATQVMAALFAGGPEAARRQIDEVLAADGGGPRSMVIGLVNQLHTALYMLEGTLGGSAEEYINVDWLERE